MTLVIGEKPGRVQPDATTRLTMPGQSFLQVVAGSAAEQLSRLAPVAIIAETLGYHPATIERHAASSSAGYTEYIATISDASST